MLVLFDQGTPVGIRDSLSGHTVKTAREQGWSTLLNGELLVYQQTLADRKIAIVVLGRNRWSLIQPLLARIVQAVNTARSGTYTVVEIPYP